MIGFVKKVDGSNLYSGKIILSNGYDKISFPLVGVMCGGWVMLCIRFRKARVVSLIHP